MASKRGKKEEKPKVNYEEIINSGLSNLELTPDRSGIACTNLNLSEKGLEAISSAFQNYKHLIKVDLSHNSLSDFGHCGGMASLITLNVEENNIKDLKSLINEENFKNLQFLNASKNKISDLPAIKAPRLQFLDLSDNKIEKTEAFEGHANLIELNLARNKLNSCNNISNMTSLKILNLNHNNIKNIAGLENLPTLQRLLLRKNNIDSFDETFPALEALEYLNLRETRIEKLDEISKIAALTSLKTFSIIGCPFIVKFKNSYFFEILNLMPWLKRINKTEIKDSLKEQTLDFFGSKYRKEQEAKALAEKLEEERLRQEAEQEQNEE